MTMNSTDKPVSVTTAMPPDFADKSLVEAIEAIMSNDRPYFTRRNKGHYSWEVCYQGEKDVVSPVVAQQFHDYGDAKQFEIECIADVIRQIANGK
jgi:hypothetical protein